MFKAYKAAIGAAVLAVGLGAGVAQASFVNGSITITDGLLGLPSTPSTSAVSALTGIQHAGNGVAFGCTSDFVGSCAFPGLMTDWVFAGPYPNIIVINGFTFDLTGVGAITSTPLTCGGGTCNDGLLVSNLVGTVSGNGFSATAFSGFLSFSGSCKGGNGQCTSDITGGYTYSLSATGTGQVPEPSTLLLIGIALAGLGFMRRKNA